MRDVDPGWRGAVFICHNQRDPGSQRASCGASDGAALRAWLRDALRARGLKGEILCTRSGCLDVCSSAGVTVALMRADGGRREVFVVTEAEREALLARVLAAFGERGSGPRELETGD